jgi:glycerol-3-phosphate acyltransferase PlsY
VSAVSFAFVAAGYLLGSIPSAYLVTRATTGKDIRRLGDGNVGAKNTAESVGLAAGLIVAIVDVGKGALAVAIPSWLSAPEHVILIAGAGAVLGHDFPVFLGFRGGQGMAVLLGVFAVLIPVPLLEALIVFLLALRFSRNWDLSWAAAFVALVVLLWVHTHSLLLTGYAVAMLPTIGAAKGLQTRRSRHPGAGTENESRPRPLAPPPGGSSPS